MGPRRERRLLGHGRAHGQEEGSAQEGPAEARQGVEPLEQDRRLLAQLQAERDKLAKEDQDEESEAWPVAEGR